MTEKPNRTWCLFHRDGFLSGSWAGILAPVPWRRSWNHYQTDWFQILSSHFFQIIFFSLFMSATLYFPVWLKLRLHTHYSVRFNFVSNFQSDFSQSISALYSIFFIITPFVGCVRGMMLFWYGLEQRTLFQSFSPRSSLTVVFTLLFCKSK